MAPVQPRYVNAGSFLNIARQVFDMIDVDQSGSLDKAEVVNSIRADQKVIKFLVNCGNKNLQYLLVPQRLEAALNVLDTDRDGEISAVEWEEAIETALANKLEARAAKRELEAKAARKEIEEFAGEFLNAARKCFQMIDVDESGTLTKAEIVEAVKKNEKVITFLRTCGEENLQFLLVPARLKKALEVLDTSKDGEVDVEEWEEAINRGLAKRLAQLADERERRERAAAAADEEFSNEFLSAARKVFMMIDKDDSGSLDKGEVCRAVNDGRAVFGQRLRLGLRTVPDGDIGTAFQQAVGHGKTHASRADPADFMLCEIQFSHFLPLYDRCRFLDAKYIMCNRLHNCCTL